LIDLYNVCIEYLSVLIASNRVRKSNCVKEVEKIQQRRMERRAAQQMIREQNEQDFDTSVPTWEFSAMIQYGVKHSSWCRNMHSAQTLSAFTNCSVTTSWSRQWL